jgi:hypothetical protein
MGQAKLYTGQIVQFPDSWDDAKIDEMMANETARAKQADQSAQWVDDPPTMWDDFKKSFQGQLEANPLPDEAKRLLTPPSLRPETFKDTDQYKQNLKGLTDQEAFESLPLTRFARGVEAPGIAIGQLVSDDFHEQYQGMTKARDRGMVARSEDGEAGMDVLGGVGQMLPATGATKVAGALFNAAQKPVRAGATAGALIGATTPTDTPDLKTKLMQTAMGAGLGGAPPAIVATKRAAQSAGETVHDLFVKGGEKRIAKNYLTKETGEHNIPQVQKELREAKELVPGSKPTASDALGQSQIGGGTVIMRHQDQTLKQAKGPSQVAWEQKTTAHNARMAHLGTFAKDKEILAQAVKDRTKNAAPDLATVDASTAKVDVTRVNSLITRVIKKHSAEEKVVSGMEQARKALYEANPLKARGKTHWDTVEKKLKGTMGAKDKKALKDLRTIMDRVKKGTIDKDEALIQLKDKAKATKGVTAKSSDLYTDAIKLMKQADTKLRTNVNDLISARNQIRNMLEDVTKEGTPVHKLIKKELAAIKKAIDHQIAKVEPAHKRFLRQWAEESKAIDQMRVGQALQKKLEPPSKKEAQTSFLNIANEELKLAKLAKVATGGNKSSVLTKEQQKVVDAVVADVERSFKAAHPVQPTDLSGGVNVVEGVRDKLPQMLSRVMMGINFALRSGASRLEPRVDKLLTYLYHHPDKLADFLEQAPPAEQQALIDAIMKQIATATAVSGSRQF